MYVCVRTVRIVRFVRVICFQVIRYFREKNETAHTVTARGERKSVGEEERRRRIERRGEKEKKRR